MSMYPTEELANQDRWTYNQPSEFYEPKALEEWLDDDDNVPADVAAEFEEEWTA